MEKMKSLTLQGITFEVTDEQARNDIQTLSDTIEAITPVQSDLAQNDPTQPDYVKNRTHWEETTTVNEPLNITWDGNTEGLVSVGLSDYSLYKVSDLILTDEQIKLGGVTINGKFFFGLGDDWDWHVEEGYVSDDYVFLGDGVFVLAFIRKENTTFDGLTFSESGIYFYRRDVDYVTSLTTTEPVVHTKTVVHKLDKKFMPISDEIIFTGVMNADGWYDYTCNVDYAKARKALIDGATARMILVSGNEITHLTLQSVTDRNHSVTLNFFDIKNIDNLDGVIRYREDGTIGSGVE